MLKLVTNATPDRARRLQAVIAALEAQRPHLAKLDDDDDADIRNYNRWICMLEGVVDGDWSLLTIDNDIIPAGEYLMHLDAAIAFLKSELGG